MFDTVNSTCFFPIKKHRLPICSINNPLKMAFQNTVGKGENAGNNFLHVSWFFFTFPRFI